MQGRPQHLGRVNDPRRLGVFVGSGQRVEADVIALVTHLFNHHSAFVTGVFGNLAEGRGQGLGHNTGPDRLFRVQGGLEAFGQLGQAHQGCPTTGYHPFRDRGFGGVHGIFNAQLPFLQFGFGGRAHFNYSHATDQAGDPLLQLFGVVVAVGGGQFVLELLHTRGNGGLICPIARHDRGRVLGDRHLLGISQNAGITGFELRARFFAHHLAIDHEGDIFEHELAALAKARSFHSGHVQHAPQFVDHQGGKRVAFNILGNDQQRFAIAHHSFQNAHNFREAIDFAVCQQHSHVVQLRDHPLGIGHEVGRGVAAIELHPFHHIHFGGQGFRLFHGDHAVLGDPIEGVGDCAADFWVATGGHGGNLGDRLVAADRLRQLVNFRHQPGNGFVNPAPQGHGVGTGGHIFHALTHQGLGQHGGRRGSVTSNIFGFGGHFAHQASTRILQGAFQFNFFRDRDAVIHDAGNAKFLFQQNVSAFRAQRDAHGIGQGVNTVFEGAARFVAEGDDLNHRGVGSLSVIYQWFTPRLYANLALSEREC